ncbi:TIGR03936 family radical SAM-associated protein [Aquisphaera insulae]|uniref:TIGR03936 family radical SAM-associated protein n=1 Tax=Aquisphaera insulae TaxID=2712864 RepID=UPI0013ED9AD4|nr:TIGR03936 family radical SAM-associated protein [Aquisphaera insulae]
MTTATTMRLRFAKRGDLRLISHRDLLRCLERMLRRARLPVAMSQGFNPRARIVFALPLGLGIEGCDEIVDLELSRPEDPGDVLRRLRDVSPPGFAWLDAEAIPGRAPAPRPVAAEYRLEVPPERRREARSALQALLGETSRPVIRRRQDSSREQPVDVRAALLDAELTDDGTLRARLRVTPEGSARPEELLEALGLRDLLDRGSVVARARVELASADERTTVGARGGSTCPSQADGRDGPGSPPRPSREPNTTTT